MMKCSFAVVSDPHYFSPTLTDGKRAYELRSGSDQKCILESAAIVKAAFKKLAEDDSIDAVLIPGDLSNDGEIASHEEFSALLHELKKHKKVFVTTATHDFCCDNNANVYFGEEKAPLSETADIPYLRKTYAPFGPCEALSVYENFNGLCSYVVKLSEGVRLFGLNDDQDGNGSSGYSDEHFSWILQQMEEAKKAGDRIIAMQHHVCVPHFTKLLTGGGICCGNKEKVAEEFAKRGTDILFVGHSHWQNITEYHAENGNLMTQVNVGSLSGHPAPIFKVDISDDEIEMHTEYVTEFEFNGKTLTHDYIREHSKGLVRNVLKPASEGNLKEFTERLGALGVHSKAPEKLFFAIKRLCAYISSVKVGSLAKTVNRLTFGKGIRKACAEEISETAVIELIYNIFLNLFDGGLNRYEQGSAVYNVVSDFVSIPSRLLSHFGFVPQNIKNIVAEIHEIVCLLMDDGVNNNYKKIAIKKEVTT